MKQSKKLMDFFEKYILFELHYIISHICMSVSVRLSESFCGNSLVSNFLVKITLTNEHLFFNYFIGLSISYSFASYGRMNVLFIVFCIYWLRNPVNIFEIYSSPSTLLASGKTGWASYAITKCTKSYKKGMCVTRQ